MFESKSYIVRKLMIVQGCCEKNSTCIECHSIEIGPCDTMLVLFRVYHTHSTTFEGVESKILDFWIFLRTKPLEVWSSEFWEFLFYGLERHEKI